jgi:hypothetical protein
MPQYRPTRPGHRLRGFAGLLAAAAMGMAAAPVQGGAWVQKKDSYYFKVAVSYLDSDRELNFNGDEVDILSGDTLSVDASYRDVTISTYLEYGITDRLTVVGTLPFKVLTSKRTQLSDLAADVRRDVDATTGGLGDLGLGLRYPLLTTPFPVSLQGTVKMPLGYDRSPENMGPPLGSGHVDVEAALLAGVSLYPFPGYITGSAGYRARGGELADELMFNIEGGVTWRRVMARFGADATYSTGDPPDLARTSSSVVITEQDVVKVTPAVAVLLSDEISLVIEAFHTVDGKNTVTGTTWSAGIAFRQ